MSVSGENDHAAAHLRPADVADAAAIADIYRPYVIRSMASFEEVPPVTDEIGRRMLAPPRLPWFVVSRADDVVGYSYASRHHERPGYRWSVNCAVYLAESERGHGTGRALYERLLPQLRSLGYVTAFAGIALPNPPSVRLHKAVGFTQVGVLRSAGFKHGRWLDVGWWQRPLRDRPQSPREPEAWSPDAPGSIAVRKPYGST